ncbi:hypothetical protein [Nesterenkonia sp.]|uniref:hypothetical protein n=1 Tax=Nesterenkonia sp. TaxID=704201 RepID=UPI00262BAA0C|nr:hypothetical protein [Nesterenkonia sp.]
MPGMQSNYAAHDDDAPPARKKTLRVLTGLGIVAAAAAALVMLVSVLSPGNARPGAGDAAAPAATAETAGSSEEGCLTVRSAPP